MGDFFYGIYKKTCFTIFIFSYNKKKNKKFLHE